MYWTWMQENNKSALDASKHFDIEVGEVWKQINEQKNPLNLNYSYCLNEKSCIHRRGCGRNLINYTGTQVKELYTNSRFIDEIDDKKCVPDYKDINCKNDFQHLDRFRLSDGSDIKQKKEER